MIGWLLSIGIVLSLRSSDGRRCHQFSPDAEYVADLQEDDGSLLEFLGLMSVDTPSAVGSAVSRAPLLHFSSPVIVQRPSPFALSRGPMSLMGLLSLQSPYLVQCSAPSARYMWGRLEQLDCAVG